MDKRAFYAQPHVASKYEQLRFGGASGTWVNLREIALVQALLPAGGQVLDLGCGTGRLSRALAESGYSVTGLDGSAAMLADASRHKGTLLVRADAFRLPFDEQSFDCVVMLRIAFHFADLGPLLAEAARVLTPGGRLVFDTYLWSPRALWDLGRERWGGRVYAHRQDYVEGALRQAGFGLLEQRRCFLFSPYLYRRLPRQVVRLLEQVEARTPGRLLARSFWAGVHSETGLVVGKRAKQRSASHSHLVEAPA
jgi:SAM-dependent methyltransferase